MDTSTEIASHFNNKHIVIYRSTVSKILAKKDRWINLNLECQEVNVIRHHDPFLEKTMTCRVEQIMGRGVILTELLIKEKAQNLLNLFIIMYMVIN